MKNNNKIFSSILIIPVLLMAIVLLCPQKSLAGCVGTLSCNDYNPDTKTCLEGSFSVGCQDVNGVCGGNGCGTVNGVENPCVHDRNCFTTGTGTGTTTTPQPTTVAPNCRHPSNGTYPATNCELSGLRGDFYEGDRPGSSNSYYVKNGTVYTCGPVSKESTALASVNFCDNYYSQWNGYFNAPTAGKYEFIFRNIGDLKVQMDVNQDGKLDDCPPIGRYQIYYSDLGWKSYYINAYCGLSYRPRWIRVLENGGVDPNPECGDYGCNNTDSSGIHCQNVDYNTLPYKDDPNLIWYSSPVPPYLTPRDTRDFYEQPGHTDSPECLANVDGTWWVHQTDSGKNYYGRFRIYTSVDNLPAGPHKIYIINVTNVYANKGMRSPYFPSDFIEMYYKGPGMSSFQKVEDISEAGKCPFTPCLPQEKPSCTAKLSPAGTTTQPYQVTQGQMLSFSTDVTVTPSTSYLSSVTFSSDNINVIKPISSTSLSSSPYTFTTQAGSTGTATLTTNVYLNGDTSTPVCTATSYVNVLPAPPWWQVTNMDVISGGSIVSKLLTASTYFDLRPGSSSSDTPGIPIYSTPINLGVGKVSETGWNVQTSIPQSYLSYNYSYFFSRVPAEVKNAWNNLTSPSLISGNISINSLSYFDNTNSYSFGGYRWILIKKNSSGVASLTINSPLSVSSSSRYIFLVDGDLNINSNISVNNNGLIMFIVSGNINVDPNVTSISGIYLTNNQFNTGTKGAGKDTSLLNVAGSVVALNRLNLQRSLTDNINPAESFTFAPSFLLQIPYDFLQRNFNWREVNP